MRGAISPDCKPGKHKACDGTAWSDPHDQLTFCHCDCHTPEAHTEETP